ncbi:hypothetical protein [Streptomyces sp. SBT349]|uniref:hypothetical protein n=1 Tax=Streptomyces sp. SBT349 TaxID=1580539 RepID=UPI00066A8594|nr:hypothetical protein [Streptomyces sp. SBT349]
MATWHAQGVQLPAHAAALRTAYPDGAEQVLAEPGRPVPDPAALLRQAVAQREPTTAQSVSDVLLWRLRRLADLQDTGERRDAQVARAAEPTAAPVPRPYRP